MLVNRPPIWVGAGTLDSGISHVRVFCATTDSTANLSGYGDRLVLASATPVPAPVAVCQRQPGTNGECAQAADCRVLLRRPKGRITVSDRKGAKRPRQVARRPEHRNPSLSNHHEAFAVLVLATPGVLIAGRLLPPPPSLASPSRAEAQQPEGKVGTCSTGRRARTCVGGLPWEACERRRHSDEAGTPVPLDVNEAEATQEQGRGEVRVEELCPVRCALGGAVEFSHSAPDCSGGDEVERLPLEREGCAALGDGEQVWWGESKRREEKACPVGHLLSLRKSGETSRAQAVGINGRVARG